MMTKNIKPYLFLIPAFIILAVFSYWPILNAFRLSLYRTNGMGYAEFVGLNNFAELFTDPLFYKSLKVLTVFLFSLPLLIFCPLIAARILHQIKNNFASYIYRVLFVIPVVVPLLIKFLIWKSLYGYDGAINRFLDLIGLASLQTSWLGNENTVIPAVIFMGMPWAGGIGLLIYLAGFQNISSNLYEAARLDGASAVKIFFSVELPMMIPQIRVMTVLSLLAVIQSFEHVLVLTGGGPGNSSLLPGLYLFKNGFAYGKLGYASAIGFVLFCFCLSVTIIQFVLIKKRH
jgi:raffinose/stachyose/melibiose transport system permease protein